MQTHQFLHVHCTFLERVVNVATALKSHVHERVLKFEGLGHLAYTVYMYSCIPVDNLEYMT